VLIRDADGPIQLSANGCRVMSGLWFDPYTALTFTDPADLDIDHVVPLADAHRSGGWAWTTDRRHTFANDLTGLELLAVDDGTNTAKSDKSPDQWLPPNTDDRCRYATTWTSIKATWGLTITDAEQSTLRELLTACG
jgi:hypothetical protein